MNVKRIYLSSCAAVLVAGLAVLATSPWLDYTINLTTSLPGTLYVVHKGASVGRNDLVAFHWHGGATYPAGTTFIKRVVGEAGDVVRLSGSNVWVNQQYIGVAKPFSKAGVPLTPASGGQIAAGEYFVATPSPDSLDSRYALTGNVKQAEIIGRAYEVF